jgi:hypothetical protein
VTGAIQRQGRAKEREKETRRGTEKIKESNILASEYRPDRKSTMLQDQK